MIGNIPDYHIHSSVSPDSTESYINILKAAEQKGISDLMFTEHFEFFSGSYRSPIFQEKYLDSYYTQYCLWKQSNPTSVHVGFGIEFGQPNLQPETARNFLKKYPFDYVIGSCHKIDNVDLSRYNYEITNTDRLYNTYFSYLLEIIEHNLCDCLGHLDLFKRYAARQGISLNISCENDYLQKVLQEAISHGIGIEINTSGIRQGIGCMPSLDVLKLYSQLHGEIITLGSDAHTASDLQKDFDIALSYLKQAGFSYIAHYQNRKPEMIKI